MTEWITNRLPTSKDADANKQVQVRCEPGGRPEDGVNVHYLVVSANQPWWSRNAAAQPTPPPAPAPTRVVTAMVAADDKVYAACNDGTVWVRFLMGSCWEKLPSIPQPEASDA
jgi:hypothetical protein